MSTFEQLHLNKLGADTQVSGIQVSVENDNIEMKIMRDVNLKIVYTENTKVTIHVTKDSSVQLFHEIQSGVGELELWMKLSQGSTVSQLILQGSAELQISEQYELHRNAQLKCAFGELTAGNSQHKALYRLVGQGSDLQATYVYMNSQKSVKTNQIVVHHETGYTTANVENYGVVAGKSRLNIDVDAKIDRGAVQSATHQTSRILTFEDGVNAKVTPSLYIDENDVQASHACSMGIIDENHLYYLQSRGLTRKQAVGLIVSGYLSPLSEIFSVDELREEVSHMIESKAGEYIGYEFDSQ